MKILLLFVVSWILCTTVDGALSRHNLLSYSSHVFTGLVIAVDSKKVEHTSRDNWTNHHLRLIVEVRKVVETKVHSRNRAAEMQGHPSDVNIDETLLKGTLVYVLLWVADLRPEGWKGDGGSSTLPVVGKVYGFFTYYVGSSNLERSLYQKSFPYDPSDKIRHTYSILMPNGIAPALDLDPDFVLGEL